MVIKKFKDALIWETIHEYALNHTNTTVYFVSENHTDFAELRGDEYYFRSDYCTGNDRIKYKRTLDDLLEAIEVIRPYYGLLNHNIISKINSTLEDGYAVEDLFLEDISNLLLNDNFEGDYFSGWGTEPNINTFNHEINAGDVFTSDSFIYIPVIMEINIEFSIETLIPIYEEGEEQHVSESGWNSNLLINLIIVYDIESDEISGYEDITVDFL